MNAFTPPPASARPYAIGRDAFREAMRHLAGGVCVVTAGIGEDRTGLTATSPTSFSADPPTLLACVNRDASALPTIAGYRHFAVNVLAEHQRHVAENFAGKGGLKGAQRYRGAEWSMLQTGAAALDGALVSLDCELDEMIERHSHIILIGRVVDARVGQGSEALVYWRGDYGRLGRPAPAASLVAGLAPF